MRVEWEIESRGDFGGEVNRLGDRGERRHRTQQERAPTS